MPTEQTREVLTDQELCDRLRITTATLRNYMRSGPPERRNPGAADVRDITHFYLGGSRRWVRKAVDEFIHGNINTENHNGNLTSKH